MVLSILSFKSSRPTSLAGTTRSTNSLSKNLTVSNGTENYKQFVEISYAAACNSDGVCYVTMELMEFLQKFSVSQRLFFDGNGFVESTGVYAAEDDQWLFACGYYAIK